MSSKNIEVVLYTDGACSGNPGPGGWAYILRHLASNAERVDSGGQEMTTNNQMEMLAVIRGLEALSRKTTVKIVSDSSYVLKGIEEWMPNWKRRDWKRKEKGKLVPVKNIELWQKLDTLLQEHDVELEHVRGHSGHPENERCDELAVAAYQQYR